MTRAASDGPITSACGGEPTPPTKPSSSRGHGRVRVIICDAHPSYREECARVIREWPEFKMVEELEDFATLAAFDNGGADVLLIDPESLQIDAGDMLAWAQGGPHVLCISRDAPGERLYRALVLGACGYLDKSCSPRELCDAIAATARGESRLGEGVQAALAKELRMRKRTPDRPLMTPRELEVLRLIARGLSAPDIADTLCLSTATIKTHQSNIYTKLGVHDRAASVATAMRLGLIE
jgi:two-component system nitrate/nitrite response regulator NarL